MNQNSLEQDLVEVVVVGRSNIDLTLRVPFRPTAGETVLASALTNPGGKSYNQARTIARLGGRVALVAQVGDDSWGHQIEASLIEYGIVSSCFRRVSGASTGVAVVEVSPDGENSIVLAVSEATELTRNDIHLALLRFAAPTVVQLDLPADALSAFIELPAERLIVGNLVPSHGVDARLLERLDIIVVNEAEASQITNMSDIDPVTAAGCLRELGPSAAVVTAGRRGAAYSSRDGSDLIPADAVAVVDTTGAGDAFLGSFALDVSRGMPLARAVARAVRVGTGAVQHHGPVSQRPPEDPLEPTEYS